MERSAPKIANLIADYFFEPCFHLACGFVCESYGYNVPGIRRAGTERIEHRVKLLSGVIKRILQLLYGLFIGTGGNGIRIICVSVFEDKAYTLRKDSGFSRTCPRKNKQRAVNCVHSLPLLCIEMRIFFVEKRALCFQILGFYILSAHN